VRFYVRFDPVCDYVHHFVTLRANKGLRGGDKWSGFGGAGERPVGDERFSTALEPWGNWARWPAPGKLNFYSYWHEMRASPDGKYWGTSFLPEPQAVIQKDRWICAEFMLKHNTPGQSDGGRPSGLMAASSITGPALIGAKPSPSKPTRLQSSRK
jgi:hypothetical protein